MVQVDYFEEGVSFEQVFKLLLLDQPEEWERQAIPQQVDGKVAEQFPIFIQFRHCFMHDFFCQIRRIRDLWDNF